MKPVVFHCEADVELTATAKHYACARPELARDFIRAFRTAKNAITEQPERFSLWKSRSAGCGFRVFRIELFMKNWMIVCWFLHSCTTAVNQTIGKAD